MQLTYKALRDSWPAEADQIHGLILGTIDPFTVSKEI